MAAAFADAICVVRPRARTSRTARRRASFLAPRSRPARWSERSSSGEAGILDVIDARRVLLEARREVLSSARERDVECGALILLSGRELP